MFIVLLIIILLFAAFSLNSISVIVVSLLMLAIGNGLIILLSDKQNKKQYLKIYNSVYTAYTSFALICTFFMQIYGFDYLLVTDTITAYIPYSKEFIQMNSLREMWDTIYNNNVEAYKHTGIITIYFALIGKFASLIDNELYFNLQTSIVFLSSFVSLFVYKLLNEQGIKSAFKYCIIYSLLSIHFYYSSLILRDIPISLFYVIVFCYIFNTKRNFQKAIIVISLCILLTSLIRLQSGLFLLLFTVIPFINDKINIKSMLLASLIGVLILIVFLRNSGLDVLIQTLDHSETILQNKAADSTLNKFNSLPPIISHIVKVLYIHISPIPSWSFMNIASNTTPENNLMGLPRAIAVLYNFVILGFILYGMWNIRKIKIDYKLIITFAITLLYMALQTDSTEQRRIMACYPVLLLVACKVNDSIPQKKSKVIQELMVIFFILIQIIGITKYV